MDPGLMATDDGGKTWRRVDEANKHGDNHAMGFVKGDPGFILNGSDGGLYVTYDAAKTWRFFENLPVTQFYKLAIDNALPFYNVHGGAQDNETTRARRGPSTRTGISNFDWTITYGADGYACAIDPTDPNTVYVEWQMGTALRQEEPRDRLYQPAGGAGRSAAAVQLGLADPHQPVLAHAHLLRRPVRLAQRRPGDSWTRISPDLTRGLFRLEQKIMGRQWSVDGLWDHGAMSFFGTITSLSESRLQEGLIGTPARTTVSSR